MPGEYDDLLPHTATLYHMGAKQDADAGLIDPYGAPYARNVQCGVQYESSDRIIDEPNRLTEVNSYTVYFNCNPGFAVDDKIVWVDRKGKTRVLFISGNQDFVDYDGLVEVAAVERL